MKEQTAKPIRVLVADDEPAIRESYRDILQGSRSAAADGASGGSQDVRARLFGNRQPAARREEFDLVFCAGAEEAVAAVKRADEDGSPFSLAFLDMRMPPGPDGVWAATHIRAVDSRMDIVVATAYSDVDPEEISRRAPPAGSLFYLQKPFHAHEVHQLASALGRRRRAEDSIRQLAYFDDVTGLPNRAYFVERLELAVEIAERSQGLLAVLFLDLDNFKRINDTLGHTMGDLLLSEVSKRLALNLRSSDAVAQARSSQSNECFARLGGDEFTILLTDLTQREDAALVARRVRDCLSRPIDLAGHEITVTTSIGVAVFPEHGRNVETLIKNADMAMYFAKRKGRNAFHFFDESMNVSAMKRMALEKNLHRALERGELSLHYQPQVEVKGGAICGAEALLRWNNAELGQVSPAEFIPLAEETGLILPIGEWVLRTACAQAKAWRDAGVPLPRVAVNVSVRQFAQDGFAALVKETLDESGLPPECLEIEITESLLLKDGGASMDTIRALKAVGVQLAIDDFGTGYSSLAYLKQLPIDRLKIDRTFVSTIHTDARDCAIAAAVIAMAKSMNLIVIAEGVETEGQQGCLESNKCVEAQGYLYSRPLPPDQAREFFRGKVFTPTARLIEGDCMCRLN